MAQGLGPAFHCCLRNVYCLGEKNEPGSKKVRLGFKRSPAAGGQAGGEPAGAAEEPAAPAGRTLLGSASTKLSIPAGVRATSCVFLRFAAEMCRRNFLCFEQRRVCASSCVCGASVCVLLSDVSENICKLLPPA